MSRLLGSVVGALKCVGPAASPGLAQTRLATCQKCPRLTKAATCRECGCYMPKKVTCTQERTLSGVQVVVCPLGKW